MIKPEWRDHFGAVRTRLNAFTLPRLINWGYVMCDLSRSYFRREKAHPVRLPFQEFHFSDLPSEVA